MIKKNIAHYTVKRSISVKHDRSCPISRPTMRHTSYDVSTRCVRTSVTLCIHMPIIGRIFSSIHFRNHTRKTGKYSTCIVHCARQLFISQLTIFELQRVNLQSLNHVTDNISYSKITVGNNLKLA